MTYRHLLGLKAVACGAGCALYLLWPGGFFRLLGVTLAAGSAYPARQYGAALSGIAVLTWCARGFRAADARRAVLLLLLVYDAVGAAVSLIALARGTIGSPGWGVFVVYALFAAGAAWLWRAEPRGEPAGAGARSG